MKKQNKKLTVTIGISAYNEEKNIGNLLNSLLIQKEKSISIKKIIVISDGSTDNTVNVVREYKNKKIHLISGHVRLGKPSRLNQMFSFNTSAVFFVVDADTFFKDLFAIEKLARKFTVSKNVGLVTGNVQPLKAQTLIAAGVNNYFYARNTIEKEFNIGKTGYSVHGYLAYSKKFLEDFRIPSDILNDDAYSYFKCISSFKWRHIYAKNSIVYNRSAGTITDYVKQLSRYIIGGKQLYEYFDKNIVTNAIKLPTEVLLKIMLYQILKNPFAYVLLKILTLSCLYYSKIKNQSFVITWPTISTSKSLL